MRWPVALLFALASCTLPSNVRYVCEPDGTCTVKGQTCGPDGYCHLPSEFLDDGGLALDGGGFDAGRDAGPCVRHDTSADCNAAECGLVFDGCELVECANPSTCPAPQECGVDVANRCGFPHLCTPDGWCWEHPFPQGHSLYAGFRLDSRHMWFVGESATVLFQNGERSSLEAAPGSTWVDLKAIHGTGPDDLFAVGTQGAIVHYDGGTWEAEGANPSVTTELRAVYSFGDGGALAGGVGGVLLSRNPGRQIDRRWLPELFTANEDIRRLFVDPASGRAFALTRAGRVYGRPASAGAPWELVANLGFGTVAVGAWKGAFVFGGNSNNILVHDLDAGSTQLFSGLSDVGDIIPMEDGGLMLMSTNGQFAFLLEDGGVSPRLIAPNGVQLNAAVSLGERKLLTVGLGGVMGVADFGPATPTWVIRSSMPRTGHNLNAVCGTSSTHLFALGGVDQSATDPARWLERTITTSGVDWAEKSYAYPSTVRWQACFAEPSRVWLIGNDSKAVVVKGATVDRVDFTGSFAGSYLSGWGLPDAGYAFVRDGFGDMTTSATGTGNFFGTQVDPIGRLQAVWGFTPDNVVTVGTGGSVFTSDGGEWTDRTVAGPDLHAVHGDPAMGSYVAVGDDGTTVSIDMEFVTPTALDPLLQLKSVWMSSTGTVWAAGSFDGGSAVMRRTSGQWEGVPLRLNRPLTGVWGLDENGQTSVWVVGPRGTILRHD